MVTDSAGRALGLLRQLDERARREAVEHLINKQLLELNGFTLYKYHILPRLCSESQGIGSLLVHYAQVRAGLRWSYFTEEEEEYWVAQTTELREGSILPLDPITYQKFASGSFSETAMTVSVPDMLPPAKSTGCDGRMLFEKHARVTLECLDSAVVEGVDVAKLWERLSDTEQGFWHNVSAVLLGKVDDPSGDTAPERLLDCHTTTQEMGLGQAQELKTKMKPRSQQQRTALAPKGLSYCAAPSYQAKSDTGEHSQESNPLSKLSNKKKRRHRTGKRLPTRRPRPSTTPRDDIVTPAATIRSPAEEKSESPSRRDAAVSQGSPPASRSCPATSLESLRAAQVPTPRAPTPREALAAQPTPREAPAAQPQPSTPPGAVNDVLAASSGAFDDVPSPFLIKQPMPPASTHGSQSSRPTTSSSTQSQQHHAGAASTPGTEDIGRGTVIDFTPEQLAQILRMVAEAMAHAQPAAPDMERTDRADTRTPVWRDSEVGFFHPDCDDTQQGQVITVGHDTVHRDVHTFIDRLKDAVMLRGEPVVRDRIPALLRGKAQQWYTTGLSELEKAGLRASPIERWFVNLRERF